MMRTQKSKANKTRHAGDGFSLIELIITATIIAIVSAFGVIGISRAKASIRLSGAAREYASYIEKARTLSIRNHADDASERATIIIADDKSSYTITMDLDGDGDLDTRTISLPSDVKFDNVETIAFDWRGRTWSTVGGITTSNAQVSIRLKNGTQTVSVDVTGSGDVTVDSKVFDDSVPNVNLKVGDLVSGATPVPTPNVSATATPTPASSGSPNVSVDPTPTPTATPSVGGSTPNATPTPGATATPTPSASPSATATPAPSPIPSPTPYVCTVTVDKVTALLLKDATTTIKVSHSGSTSLTVSASSSKPSDLQVTPGSQTVAAGGTASFTVKSKNSTGVYSVTFSTPCGSKAVPVTIVALL